MSVFTTFEERSRRDTLLSRNFCRHGPVVMNGLVLYRGLNLAWA